jgi:copper chaperone CopZ
MSRKLLPIAVIAAAGIALGYVALRAPTREYVAPTLAEVEAHAPAPTTLVGEVPAGCVVRAFAVEGMCCQGCTGKIYKRLKATSGVVQAAVDFEGSIAQVVVSETTDIALVESALTFDKYSAKRMP